MNFSRDIKDDRYWTPRSLQTSKFGPYSRLTVERKSNAKQWAWAIGLGIVIGACWYLGVGIRAGA